MRKIYKYSLPIQETFNLHLPRACKIVKVGSQGDAAFLWAEVHPGSEPENIVMHCHGTGHDIPEDGRKHFATVLVSGWVWHFYREADWPCP